MSNCSKISVKLDSNLSNMCNYIVEIFLRLKFHLLGILLEREFFPFSYKFLQVFQSALLCFKNMRKFVAEWEKFSLSSCFFKVQIEIQPTFSNLPFPIYHSLNILTLGQTGRLNQTLHPIFREYRHSYHASAW